MSRAPIDTVLGIAGSVAIVFMLIGVFAYEYNTVPTDSGMAETPAIMKQNHDGTLAQGQSFVANFTPGDAVVSMDITITWTSTAPAAAEALASYSYQLMSPDGVIVDSGSSAGITTINVVQPTGGEYLLTISAPAPSVGGDFRAQARYDY